MLGSVTEKSAKLWLRTTRPAEVTCVLYEVGVESKKITLKVRTQVAADNTCFINFTELKKESKYKYSVRVGEQKFQASFSTLGPSLKQKSIRLIYGSCYNHKDNRMEPGTSVFSEMASRKGDLNIFLGDFPYTKRGEG